MCPILNTVIKFEELEYRSFSTWCPLNIQLDENEVNLVTIVLTVYV